MKYRVSKYGNIYEVVETESGETKHQGSLSDCEAWIRLVENGYLNE